MFIEHKSEMSYAAKLASSPVCPSIIFLLLDDLSSPMKNAEFLPYGPPYLNLLEVTFACKPPLIRIYLSALGVPILPPLLSILTILKRPDHCASYPRPHFSPDSKHRPWPIAKEHIVLVQLYMRTLFWSLSRWGTC